MSCTDAFNGDADGICALVQLRLSRPQDSCLVTGVKRDIALLDRVVVGSGDVLTVLDISLNKNRAGLLRALESGAEVLYVDHHQADDIPKHPGLTVLIDTHPETCTSLLMNEHLGGAHGAWAVVGAFGDNMHKRASALAHRLGLSEAQIASMRRLGYYINYNSYGVSVDDLHYSPENLYRILAPHSDPLSFLADEASVYEQLARAYEHDMSCVHSVRPEHADSCCAVYFLPAEKWANRVSGVWGNQLANEHPRRAHAILTTLDNGNYRVSVRAPLDKRYGAETICQDFPTGGGRKAAAGINELPADMLEAFVQKFSTYYASV